MKFCLKKSRIFGVFQLPSHKKSYLNVKIRVLVWFVTRNKCSGCFLYQILIFLDSFTWMLNYFLKNLNFFQSFCFTLSLNFKNFLFLLKARTKTNWTFKDFQVSTVFVDIIARRAAAGNSNWRRTSYEVVGKNKQNWGKFLKFKQLVYGRKETIGLHTFRMS